jgi:hypothetical protein
MDKEKEQKLIEAAKRELGITGDLTKIHEMELLAIHMIYDEWKGPETEDPTDRSLSALIGFKKAGDRLLKADVGESMFNREYVEKAIESLNPYVSWSIEHEKIQKLLPRLPLRRGKPLNQRLHQYIWLMLLWFAKYFPTMEPAYGTNSIFTRLIGACLAIIDPEKYNDNPPTKAIKIEVTNHRTLQDILKMRESIMEKGTLIPKKS